MSTIPEVEGMVSYRSFPEAVREYLKLCRVKEGEKVVILTVSVYDEELINAYKNAITELGADCVQMVLPNKVKNNRLTTPLNVSRLAVDMLKRAAMIIRVDSESPYLTVPPPFSMYSDEMVEILKSGARWLDMMLKHPRINLLRLFPDEDLIRRTKAGREVMARAKSMRIISEAGTDLIIDKTGRKAAGQYGIVDTPGRWDNSGFGLVSSGPKEDGVNGTLVINTNDYLLPLDRDVIEPIKCTIKDGYITRIEGGFSAKLLRRWFENWKDPESYGISHVGWGTQFKAVWRESRLFCVADAESYPGVMQIAFGSNFFDAPVEDCGVGGTRHAASHIDIDCLGMDYYCDDVLVVEKGNIVHP